MLRRLISLAILCCIIRYSTGDEELCGLNALSPFSYMVKLVVNNEIIAHGSIFVSRAVLTVCSRFHRPGKTANINATAGRIESASVETNYRIIQCEQVRHVLFLDCHPKSVDDPGFKEFDWAIAVLEKPFDVDNMGFHPRLPFPTSPSALVWMIRAMDRPNAGDCDLVIFADNYQTKPRVVENTAATMIPFSDCIQDRCYSHQSKASAQGKKDCEKYFESVANSSFYLCAYSTVSPILTEVILKGRTHQESIQWHLGAPLICEGMTLGITREVISYLDQFKRDVDTFFVESFLRSWNYFMAIRKKYGISYPNRIRFNPAKYTPVEFSNPATLEDNPPTEVSLPAEFYRNQDEFDWYQEKLKTEPRNRARTHDYPGFLMVIVVGHLGGIVF